MADEEQRNEQNRSDEGNNNNTTNNHGNSFYVLNYSFTIPTGNNNNNEGQQMPQTGFPMFGPAGLFVMNGTQGQGGGEPMEGVEFGGFDFNNNNNNANTNNNGAQAAPHPFANLFGHARKPRASERAISKLKELSEDELGPSEKTCPICFDKYELVKKEDLANDNDNGESDPPISIPQNQHNDDVTSAQITIETEMDEDNNDDSHRNDNDPDESVPTAEDVVQDPEESVPNMEQGQDPDESVPNVGEGQDPDESVPNMEADDPEESVPDPQSQAANHDVADDPEESVHPNRRPEGAAMTSADPEESVPESGRPSNHRPVELPCGHRFGQSCIKEWLGSSNTCPLCRTELESQDEYLRSTGQAPERGHYGNGILDFIFHQVPEVLNIIRREVNNNQNNDNVNPVHLHIVRDDDGTFRTHRSQQNGDGDVNNDGGNTDDGNAAEGGNDSSSTAPAESNNNRESNQQARHTFINGNRMSELLRAFTSPSPSPNAQGQPQSGLFRIARMFGSNPSTAPSNRNRESRHHPYTRSTSSGNSESSDSRDLQCASLPLAMCVGDSENESIIRLSCGHGYHDGCLRMAMRAHGDGDNVDSEGDVWCICCSRYRTLSN